MDPSADTGDCYCVTVTKYLRHDGNVRKLASKAATTESLSASVVIGYLDWDYTLSLVASECRYPPTDHTFTSYLDLTTTVHPAINGASSKIKRTSFPFIHVLYLRVFKLQSNSNVGGGGGGGGVTEDLFITLNQMTEMS